MGLTDRKSQLHIKIGLQGWTCQEFCLKGLFVFCSGHTPKTRIWYLCSFILFVRHYPLKDMRNTNIFCEPWEKKGEDTSAQWRQLSGYVCFLLADYICLQTECLHHLLTYYVATKLPPPFTLFRNKMSLKWQKIPGAILCGFVRIDEAILQ